MSAAAILSAGRLLARQRAPYLSAVIVGLAPQDAPGLGTVGVTENGVLLIDPDFVVKLSAQEMAGLVVHEVMHVVLRHAARGRVAGRDPRIANMADDLAINPAVLAMGLSLPEGGLFPAQFGFEEGLTADAYYELLLADAQAREASRDSEQSEQGEGRAPKGDPTQHGHEPRTGGGHCGSCAGRAMPGEPDASDEASRSHAEMERLVRCTAEAIREASQTRGKVPAGLARAAEAMLAPPRIDWRRRLAALVRNAVAWRAGAVDARYDAPGRRQAGLGYGAGRPVMPRLRQPIPEVMLVVDTSGSMGTAELSAAVSEASGVLRALGVRAQLATCDAAVQGLRPVRDVRDVLSALRGGGGTDLRPAFAAAEKLRPRPEVVIAITDGLVGDGVPTVAPRGMRVLWVGVGKFARRPASWGDYVEVENSP